MIKRLMRIKTRFYLSLISLLIMLSASPSLILAGLLVALTICSAAAGYDRRRRKVQKRKGHTAKAMHPNPKTLHIVAPAA